MQRSIELYATFIGHDATIRIDYSITNWGYPAVIDYVNGGEPAESPDWEIDDIGITLEGPEWMIDWRSQQFLCLANSELIERAILSDIVEIERPRRRTFRRIA